jgi:hypothetical protein
MHTAVRHGNFARKLHIYILCSTGALFCATSHIHAASYVFNVHRSPPPPPPGVNRRGRDVHNSPSPSAEVRNKWRYASVPHVCLHGMDTGHVPFSFYLRQFALRFTGTRYGLDGPGIESRWQQDFPHPSRTAVGPTRPHLQWVQGLFSRR